MGFWRLKRCKVESLTAEEKALIRDPDGGVDIQNHEIKTFVYKIVFPDGHEKMILKRNILEMIMEDVRDGKIPQKEGR